ncbi:hypothetical protein VWN77_10245, partial [Campylobacter coli]
NESQKIMSDEQKYLKILNNMKLNQVRFNYNDKLWQFNDFDFDFFYEKIRKCAKNTAVVPVKKQACYGCFMKIYYNTYLSVIKGEE